MLTLLSAKYLDLSHKWTNDNNPFGSGQEGRKIQILGEGSDGPYQKYFTSEISLFLKMFLAPAWSGYGAVGSLFVYTRTNLYRPSSYSTQTDANMNCSSLYCTEK